MALVLIRLLAIIAIFGIAGQDVFTPRWFLLLVSILAISMVSFEEGVNFTQKIVEKNIARWVDEALDEMKKKTT